MRHIEIAEMVRVRFPDRSGEFDEGVEIGVLAALMALGHKEITRTISRRALEQVRPLAQNLRYRVLASGEGEMVAVTLHSPATKPSLRLVKTSA